MNERSAPASAIVCPFVAFEDDRDRRSPQPDHRHRCFAEPVPAPRALAHQQHYCLSASFATCPTFTDWAQREAAREAEPEPQPGSTMGGVDTLDAPRAMARDWAAPPPWVENRTTDDEQLGAFDTHEGAAEREQRAAPGEPGPLPASQIPDTGADDRYTMEGPLGRGAGRPADAVSRNAPEDERDVFEDDASEGEAAASMPAFLASRMGGGRSSAVQPPDDEDRAERPRRTARSAGPGAEATPGRIPRGPSQARPILSSRPERRDPSAPAWERVRRAEAYPTLRTRVGLPEIPRLGMAAIALVVAAAVLFFLPTLLAGNPGTVPGTSTPSFANPSAAATGTLAPSTPVAPTPTVYTVVAGDTLSGIAKKYGLTVSDILAANPQIKDPNKIAIGDQITIPPKPTPVSVAPGGSAIPSSSSLP